MDKEPVWDMKDKEAFQSFCNNFLKPLYINFHVILNCNELYHCNYQVAFHNDLISNVVAAVMTASITKN